MMAERSERLAVHWHNFRSIRAKLTGLPKARRREYYRQLRSGPMGIILAEFIAEAHRLSTKEPA